MRPHLKTLAALGCLVSAGAAVPEPAAARAGALVQEQPSPRIAVIRYDAETIRLTDALVMSLCRHQVELTAPPELGLEGKPALRVVPLEGEQQPPGVHVTGLIVVGADGVDAEAYSALLAQGTAHLESALGQRLLRPRVEPLERAQAQARDLERETIVELDAIARELPSLESQRDDGQQLVEQRAALRRTELELDAATRALDAASQRLDRARAEEEARVVELAQQIDELEARIREEGLGPQHSAYRRLQVQLAALGEQMTVVRMEAAHRSREAEQAVELAAADLGDRNRALVALQRSIEDLQARAPAHDPDAALARVRIKREVLERRLTQVVELRASLEIQRSALVPPSVDLW